MPVPTSARDSRVELFPPDVTSASAGQSLLAGTRRPEGGTFAIDELDTTLMRLLLDEGRRNNRELAAATGVTETTVATRVRRLVSHRMLFFTTVFDWEVAGFEWFVVAKFTVEDRAPNAVAEDIAALVECEGAAVVFGEADVLAFMLVTDRAELHTLLSERLATIPGIATSEMDVATRTWVSPLGRQFFLAQRPRAIRLPKPRIDLDQMDIGLLQALLVDSRRSNRKIARVLGVSEGTVRSRIARLTESGLVRIVAMVEPLALGLVGVVAWVGLHVDRDAIPSVSAAIERLPQALLTAVTVGSADVSVALAARSQAELLDIVLNELRALPGVRATETLQFVKFARFAPYLKRLSAAPDHRLEQ